MDPMQNKTFQQHLIATIKLGAPMVLMQIMFMLINVTDAVMLGWLGVNELAAGTLAFQTMFVVMIFGLGISTALMPLVSSAMGKNNIQAVRRSVRMTLWVLAISVSFLMIPLLFSQQILIFLGQKIELAEIAETYIKIAQWSLIPAFLLNGLRSFLASLEQTKAIVIITLLMVLLNAFLNYALIFGHYGMPRLEMEGAAIATNLVNWFGLICLIVYVKYSSLCRPFEIFKKFWVLEWEAFKEIVRMGLPISFMILFEAGLFTATSFLVGWIGSVELAAHGIALQISSLSYMIPLGMSQVASVRVANAVGRGDLQGISLAAKAVTLVALGFAFISASLFLFMPEVLIQFFLDEKNAESADVLAYAIPLLYMAAAFQIFDTLQIASAGNLRGLKDTKVPMIIASISYWPVGLGVAYVLAFPMGYGAVGIWAGLVVGLLCAAVGLTWRFSRRTQLGLVKLEV